MDLNALNQSVLRLIENGTKIISFLKDFTVGSAKDVSITYINADGSESVSTFPNIAKIVQSANVTNVGGVLKDLAGKNITNNFIKVGLINNYSIDTTDRVIIPFDKVITNTNNSVFDYNPDTGEITVLQSGTYIITGKASHYDVDDGAIARMFINARGGSVYWTDVINQSLNYKPSITNGVALYAGDKISLSVDCTDDTYYIRGLEFLTYLMVERI